MRCTLWEYTRLLSMHITSDVGPDGEDKFRRDKIGFWKMLSELGSTRMTAFCKLAQASLRAIFAWQTRGSTCCCARLHGTRRPLFITLR